MPEDERTTARRAADEAILATISAVIMIGAAVCLHWAETATPDEYRRWRMRGYRAAEKFCAASAGGWWKLAERARRAYERETL